MLKVKDNMIDRPISVNEHEDITEVIKKFKSSKLTKLPVVDNDQRVLGCLDVFEMLAVLFRQGDRVDVAQLIDPKVSCINEETPVLDSCRFPVDRLVVDSKNRLRGHLTKNELVNYLVKYSDALNGATADFPQPIMLVDVKGHPLFCNDSFKRLWRNVFTGDPMSLDFEQFLGTNNKCRQISVPYKTQRLTFHALMDGERIVGYNCNIVITDTLMDLEYPKSNASNNGNNLPKIIDQDQQMKEVMCVAKKASRVRSTILITGETGVGKNLIAEYIHRSGNRAHQPFLSINCSAIPETLLESELFGYEKGSFTGALKQGKKGLIEAADGGTLFLDEIGDMPLSLQAKLLSILQDRLIRKLGSNDASPVDVRFIAATNTNLDELILAKQFRRDLFYRLSTIIINIPPLRERLEDIEKLSHLFLTEFNSLYGENKRFGPNILDRLKSYSWPGNVRELQNVIENMVVLADSQVLESNNLPAHVAEFRPDTFKANMPVRLTMEEAKEHLEISLIEGALKRFGSVRKASQALGVDHTTILRKMRKYNLSATTKETR